jgi:branched-chain amino acid transport system substrate-binding protein
LPAVAAWNGMQAIFGVVKKHGADFTADQAMDVLSHWTAAETPAGPIAIDPATRDIIHSVSIGKITKVGDHYENVSFASIPNVKDAWKELNPAK